MKLKKLLTGICAVVIISAGLFTMNGCVKPAGYGGSSSITGKVITEYYNDDFSQLIKSEPSVDEEIFLLFGDDENVGDNEKSSANGSFVFTFLNAGNYTLYYRSDDSSTLVEDNIPILIDIELKAGEDLDLGELKEFKILDYDDGAAKIFGVIRLINYKNSSTYPFLEVKDTTFAQEHEVYITYGSHDFYDDRIRTSYNGYFEFDKLIPGEYEIFTYSEDVQGGTQDIPKIKQVTITEAEQEIDLGVITIEQL